MDFSMLLSNPKVRDMLMMGGLQMLASNGQRNGPTNLGSSLGQGMLTGVQYAQAQEDKKKEDYWNNWDRGVDQEYKKEATNLVGKKLDYDYDKLKYDQDRLDSKIDFKSIKNNGREETYRVDGRGNIVDKVGDSPLWQPQQASEGMHQVQDPSSPTGWVWANARGEILQGAPGPSKQKGMSVTLPDGTVISQDGESPLTKPAQTDLEKKIVEAQGLKTDLLSQMSKMDPKYLTRPYQWKQAAVGEASRWGIPLPESTTEDRKGYINWRAGVMSSFNNYVKSLTGTALSPGEVERHLQVMANPSDDPVEFTAKISQALDNIDRSVQRYQSTLKQGVGGTPSMTPTNKLGNQAFQKFKSMGLSNEEAKRRTLELLSRQGGYGG